MNTRKDQVQAAARTPAEDVAAWAAALRYAQEQRRPIPPLRKRATGLDVQGAYRIQELNNVLRKGALLSAEK